jgi:sec-independent protein translocase protein TatC
MPEVSSAPLPETQSREDLLRQMSFLEHLEELRKRLIYSVVSVVAGFFVCYGFIEKIYDLVQKPIIDALRSQHMADSLVYTSPTDGFNLYIKVAFLAGIFLACPVILYQIWLFISPGLYRHEKRYVVPFMISTVGLFVAGGLFAYKIAFPQALKFLLSYSHQFKPMITIVSYTDLFLTITIGLGAIFEMPILVFFLALMGIISPAWMWNNFRYSILIIFIIAAIVTPTTDVLNMCIFAAPMILLYLVSIGVAWLVHPNRRNREKETA